MRQAMTSATLSALASSRLAATVARSRAGFQPIQICGRQNRRHPIDQSADHGPQ